jgi:protein phosphatase
MLDLDFAELSDPGLVRDHNEDALGHVLPESAAQVHSQGWLFALADGAGGHKNGEQTARIAVERVLDGFRRIPKGVMHVSLLPRLVQEANVAVYHQAHPDQAHPDQTHPDQIHPDQTQQGRGSAGGRMATALLVCALRFDSAVISHVGDSRCYLFRRGVAAALTRDHTMAGEQQRLGLVSRAEETSGDNRHGLTRGLGTELFVAADTITVNIAPGDVVMLSTYGLHGYVTDRQIETILGANPDLKAAAKALVEAANKLGGHDHVSVQLLRVKSVERMGLYRGRPYRLL